MSRPARRRALSIAAGVVLGAVLWLALTLTGGPGPHQAPAFSLPRLGGGPAVAYPVRGAEARRPVVLVFFASWCTPCRAELPAVARVADQVRGAGGHVLFLGVDGNDDPASGLSFARHSGVSFAVGADRDSSLAPKFSLVGYPGTVFIDASGNVAGSVRGPVTRATLERWVSRLGAT